MVQRIRLRGHVIRFHEVPPGTSSSKGQSCPTCKTVYDNGVYRKCYYLCCEFEDCFHCVLENKSRCPIIKTRFLKETGMAVNSSDELDSDMNTNLESSGETVEFPASLGERQKLTVVSERKLKTKVSPIPNKEPVELPKLLEEHVIKIELDSNMDTQTESVIATVAPEGSERLLQMEVNTIPIDHTVELSGFSDKIPEDNSRDDNRKNNDKGCTEIESEESDLTILKLATQRLGVAAYDWLPVILLDNETFPALNSRDVVKNEEEHGISRLRNGKVFATNQ